MQMLKFVTRIIGILFTIILLSSCHQKKSIYKFDNSYFDMVNVILFENCCDSIYINLNTHIHYDSLDQSEYNVRYWLDKKGIKNSIFSKDNKNFIETLPILHGIQKVKNNSVTRIDNNLFMTSHKKNIKPFEMIEIFNSPIFIDDRGQGVFFLCTIGADFSNHLVFLKKNGQKLIVDDYIQIDTNFPW